MMAYGENKTGPAPQHRLTMEGRRDLWMNGVEEVESFDDSQVAVRTVQGLLLVRGVGLKVDKLEKTSGELTISGQVTGLEYEETAGRGGFWSRLLK